MGKEELTKEQIKLLYRIVTAVLITVIFDWEQGEITQIEQLQTELKKIIDKGEQDL